MATSTVEERIERVTLSRLWWVGLLTIVASVVANLLILLIAKAVLPISADFAPLAVGPVMMWSLIGSFGATLVFFLLARLTRRPIYIFQLIALIVFLVTLLPDITLFFVPAFPDTTAISVGTLILMHVGTALICVGFLTRLVRMR